MRYFLLIFAWLGWAPMAFASDWQTYANDRFGYVVDVPPGFSMGRAPDNNDGGTFTGAHGDRILVFGTWLSDIAFEGEASSRIVDAQNDGWKISYSRVEPDRASYSGARDSRILYVRSIRVCGDGAAFVMLEYRRQDLKAYDAIVKRMVASFKPTACAQ